MRIVVKVGTSTLTHATGRINISAVTKDKLLSVLASASAAPGNEGKAYAAAINVMNSAAKGNVALGSGGKAKGLYVNIAGVAGSTAINVTVAAAGSGGRAVGASVNANFFNRESGVSIGGKDADYSIEASKDVCVSTSGDDTSVMAALAAAGSTDGTAIGGNLPILSSRNTVRTKLARTAVVAGGEAAFASHLRDRTYALAGSIALANGGNAVGATGVVIALGTAVKPALCLAAHMLSLKLASAIIEPVADPGIVRITACYGEIGRLLLALYAGSVLLVVLLAGAGLGLMGF